MAIGGLIGGGIGLAFLTQMILSQLAEPGQRRRRDQLRIANIPGGFDDLRLAINDEERLSALIDADRSLQVNEPRDVRPLYTQEGVQEQLLRSEIGSLVSSRISAAWTPGSRPVVFRKTVKSWNPPAGTVPTAESTTTKVAEGGSIPMVKVRSLPPVLEIRRS